MPDSHDDVPIQWPDAAWKRRFRRQILDWFDHHARDLPWRRSPTLYHVWISEVMLQQTQVVTVIPYFQRFVAALPDVAALAAADEQQVLRLWEGLGYYRRARQLHAAAKKIVADHGGQFPTDIEQVRALPGIGRYTAGAILSIATGARHPILEANTVRVFSRLIAYRDDPSRSAGQKLLWQLAEELLPNSRVDAFNQALMELGSEICWPREPNCAACPVAKLCPTRELGLQDRIPIAKRRTQYEDVHEAAIVVRRGSAALLRRCQPGERWAGLWDFPRFAVSNGNGDDAPAPPRPTVDHVEQTDLAHRTRELTGITVSLGEQLATFKHGVTRFRITLTCWEAQRQAGRIRGSELVWQPVHELDHMPLSTTGRKIAKLLQRSPRN
ncbi:MAG: A/G-specific adenine glycosylase [Planctomycetales bacterium]|nr:A/G-specific adenine glycosylase [Planctomycetales bacterium]